MGMTFLADRCPFGTPRPQRRPGRTKAPQQFKVCAAPGVGRAPEARRLSKSGNDNDFYSPSHSKKCKAGLLPPAPAISLAPFPLSRPPRQPAPAELVDHHARQHGQRAHRSEEHTSELQSPRNLVCRLLLVKIMPDF